MERKLIMRRVVNNLRGINQIKAFGQSMAPLLLDGDVIYFQRKSIKSIKENDIIIGKVRHNLVIHRVIYVDKTRIVTKGDANTHADPPLSPKNIIGKVHKVRRNGTFFYPDQVYMIQSGSYLHAVHEVTLQFIQHKINYVILKGYPLSLKYEGSIPKRFYSDIDILISSADREKVLQILLRLDFQRIKNRLFTSATIKPNKISEETFVRNDKQTRIAFDIHYEAVFMMTQIGELNDLYSETNIKSFTRKLFENIRHFSYGGIHFPLIKKQYLIVYLLLHYFHHNMRGIHRLKLVSTIIKTIPKKDLKGFFGEIATIIAEYQLEGYIYGPFLSLRKYYKTIRLPRTFLGAIYPGRCKSSYISWYVDHASAFNSLSRTKAGILLFFHLFLLSPHGWLKKIRVFTRGEVVNVIITIIFLYVRKSLLLKKWLVNNLRTSDYHV